MPTAKQIKELEAEMCDVRNNLEAIGDEKARNVRWTGNPALPLSSSLVRHDPNALPIFATFTTNSRR